MDEWFEGVLVGKRGIDCFEGLQRTPVQFWDSCVCTPFFDSAWNGLDKSQKVENLLRFAEMETREDEENTSFWLCSVWRRRVC